MDEKGLLLADEGCCIPTPKGEREVRSQGNLNPGHIEGVLFLNPEHIKEQPHPSSLPWLGCHPTSATSPLRKRRAGQCQPPQTPGSQLTTP